MTGLPSQRPAPDAWQRDVVGQLQSVKEWLLATRRPRRIRLLGTRRLSASLAIGSVFSAVSGFSVDMEYRDGVWRTDAHPTAAYQPPRYAAALAGDKGSRLVVAVGVMRDVIGEVPTYTASVGWEQAPILNQKVDAAITSAEQANALVQVIKGEVAEALSRTGAKSIYPFLAGSAFLALFLGHRLNATAPVQCHERVAPGSYAPACRLAHT
ncbi:MAG: SAVED domain-containing protein [Gemmataceae bacterium]|nr:SAVED domain-containing protein [Gemmataceae bacterium]